MAGRSHSKDDKRKCSELGICGTTEQLKTKPSSEEIPAQMMDFYLKWKIFKGEAYDCTIHTLLDLLGGKARNASLSLVGIVNSFPCGFGVCCV